MRSLHARHDSDGARVSRPPRRRRNPALLRGRFRTLFFLLLGVSALLLGHRVAVAPCLVAVLLGLYSLSVARVRGVWATCPRASTGTKPSSQLSAPPENARVQPSRSQSATANVCARSSPRTRATLKEYRPSSTATRHGATATRWPSNSALTPRRRKKRVRKRPRRSAGLRRLRGGRLTLAPSESCLA